MKDCFGQHGWKEFHRNRKNILDEYQRLVELTTNRPVQTAHGEGVEAYIRKWLSEFLPKKYGVTSGYIIPNRYNDSGVIYHFDIIIYNCLEAPILWTEGNLDNSEQGKYRAIPAKHVVSVYEVKSRLTKKNVVYALEKLGQVVGFKEQFPRNYSSGIIFIELKESDNRSEAIVKALHQGKDIFGFTGGLVMRYESDDSATGYIRLDLIDKELPDSAQHLSPMAKNIDELNIYQTEDGNVTLAEQGEGAVFVAISDTWAVSKVYSVGYDQDGIYVHLSWSRSNFSRFCVDLLSSLEGLSFNDEQRPSFGMIFDSLRQVKAPLQPAQPRPNSPFLSVLLYHGSPNSQQYMINSLGDDIFITFWIEVTNEGFTEATISDDGFRSSCVLPIAGKALKTVSVQAHPKENGISIKELLDGDGLEIPYRLVYKTGLEGKELFSVEKLVLVKTDGISMSNPPA